MKVKQLIGMITHTVIFLSVLLATFYALGSSVTGERGRYIAEVIHPLTAVVHPNKLIPNFISGIAVMSLLFSWFVWIFTLCKFNQYKLKLLSTWAFTYIYILYLFYLLGYAILNWMTRFKWDNNLTKLVWIEGPPRQAAIHLEDALNCWASIFILPLAKLFRLGWDDEAILLFALFWGSITFAVLLTGIRLIAHAWKCAKNHDREAVKVQE